MTADAYDSPNLERTPPRARKVRRPSTPPADAMPLRAAPIPLRRANAMGPAEIEAELEAADFPSPEPEEGSWDMYAEDPNPASGKTTWMLTYPVHSEPLNEASPLNPRPEVLFETWKASHRVKSLIYQKERGRVQHGHDEDGNPRVRNGYLHYQGIVIFDPKIKFSTLRNKFTEAGVKCWFKPISKPADVLKVKQYCQKRDKPGVILHEPVVIVGDPQARQGKKEDQAALALEWFKTHPTATPAEFLNTFPALCKQGHLNYYHLMRQVLRPPGDRGWNLAMCFYGPTGTGKTHSAQDYCRKNNLSFYTKTESNEWWQRYDNEDVVIFDDFRGGLECKIDYNLLLRILDRGPPPILQVKGGSVALTSKIFIFTSCFPPSQWYEHQHRVGDAIDQLLRRFRTGGIFHLDRPFNFPEERKERIPAHLTIRFAEGIHATPDVEPDRAAFWEEYGPPPEIVEVED